MSGERGGSCNTRRIVTTAEHQGVPEAMRHRYAFLPMLILVLCFASCSDESGGGGAGKAKVVRPTPLLKYRFEQGQETHYLQTMKAAQKSDMFNSSQEMIFDVIVKAVKPEADGACQFTCTYDRVRMKGNNPMAGGAAEYDSKAEDAATQAKNPVVIGAVAIEGAVIAMTQQADGRITSLSGMDAVGEKMTTMAAENPSAMMVALMLKNMYTDEAWKKNLESLSVIFPSETLEPGATWDDERKIPIPGLGEIGVSTTYTFKGSEDTGATTVATVTYVFTFDLDGFKPPEVDPGDPMAALLASLKLTSGGGTGALTFDMEAGRMMKSERDLQMGVEMMGMKMQNEMKMTYELVE